MSFFSDSQVEALIDAEQVHLASLFKIDILPAPIYVSETNIPFTDLDGQTWTPMRDGIVSFSDTKYGPGLSADKRTYKLAVDNDQIAIGIVGDEASYRWRKITQYLQFFAVGAGHQPIGSPVVQHIGLMDSLSLSMSPTGGSQLTLVCEGRFVKKNTATLGYYTNSDQQLRHPGDLIAERVSLLTQGAVVRWPDF